MNSNGSNAVRLTNGLADGLPAISPDGKWVVYNALTETKGTLWKVSIDGSTHQQLSDHVGTSATFVSMSDTNDSTCAAGVCPSGWGAYATSTWQGSVQEGMTVRAVQLTAPSRASRSIVGVCAA